MAEKYGTIPKRFTKEWFDYVWTYYKWHIMGPIFVIIFVIVTAYQCTHKAQYDINITYAGGKIFSDAQVEMIESEAANYADDVNGDGKVLVNFQQINFSNTAGSEETDYNLQMKLDLQLQTKSSYLYIWDKDETDLMLARDAIDRVYVPVEDWAQSDVSDRLYSVDGGTAYAVYIGESESVKALGINTDDLYLVLMQNNTGEASDEEYANYIKFANYLIGE
ncbi:MAG: hypothetical protein LUD03_02750 [Firmicutes bacterium]|nr:hypothetical protein [Bacillota bacterium]